jgi:TPP-dependent pyruvate/acetoin dehydrogenase alpha subunit
LTRTTLDIGADAVEHLGILDEEARLDEALAPEVSDELLLEMHRVMLWARRLDERMLSLQRQGRLGTFALVKGQEAAQVGAVAALRADDWMVPSYRETAASLFRGLPPENLVLYNAGFNEGADPGDGHDLPIAIPVGSQMLHAAGLAYGLSLRGLDQVVMTFFGDGATSQGDFHEAMNFASVLHCPLVFLCQNNQYAISVPVAKQTASKTLAQKALAYGMHGLRVDGNDVLAVYSACSEAVERARREHRPTLIECVTYRLGQHTTVDDPTKYRSDEEVREWEKKDPDALAGALPGE